MPDFTLKYRPQKIAELDLLSVREGLAKVLASGRVPHAFLFSGTRGTGKTSAARIIAKAVNCENNAYSIGQMADSSEEKKTISKLDAHALSKLDASAISNTPLANLPYEPCNECSQCLSITSGNNLDVLEIDAASSRGIDDIRDLREKIRLAPTKARYKVYIIDEVHMLTTEAFNALLKTLEEPPEHAIFILCTTDPQKLPETIVSRCMRFNFQKGKIDEIIMKLEKVVSEEKLEINKEALEEIAKAARGSFRDAHKILEQVSFNKGEIGKEQVREIIGQSVGYEPEKLLIALAKFEAKEAINEINRIVSGGTNLRVYTQELLESLRNLLLASMFIEESKEMDDAVNSLTTSDLKILINLFSKAALELRDAIIPQLPLEMAVVEWMESKKSHSTPSGGVLREKPTSMPTKEEEKVEEAEVSEVETATIESLPTESNIIPVAEIKVGADGSISLEEINSHWEELVNGVKPINHSVCALLRSTRPVNIQDNAMVLEVFYKFHKEQIESEKNRHLIEEVASQIFKQQVLVRCVLGEKKNSRKAKEDQEAKIEEEVIKTASEIFEGVVE